MLPKILIPRELVDLAKTEARRAVDAALLGIFGLIQAAIMRRQSWQWAHEKALFHDALARALAETPIRIVNRAGKIRRHQRQALRFGALAKARDPRLAQACGLCEVRV